MNKRIPEIKNLYNDKLEAGLFIKASENNFFLRFFEKAFARHILLRYKNFNKISILDLGCGPAEISIALAKARPDWRIVAVDYSDTMIEFAKQKQKKDHTSVNFLKGKAENIKLMEDQFDLVISHYSFHEFEDPKKVFLNIINFSKNGAYFEMLDLLRIQNPLLMNFIAKISIIFHGTKFNYHYANSLRGAYNISELKNIFSFPEIKIIKIKPSFPARVFLSARIVKKYKK